MSIRLVIHSLIILTSIGLLSPAYGDASVAHYWPFDDKDNAVGELRGADVQGSNYSFANDRYGVPYTGAGKALQLEHAGTGFEVTLNGELDFNADFAISFWVYNDRAGDGDAKGVRVFDTLNGTSSGIQLGTNASNEFNLRLDDHAGNSLITNNVGAKPQTPENGWSHVCINVTQGNAVVVYFDGIQVDSDASALLTGVLSATQALQIGMINSGGSDATSQRGAIDDLAFYHGVLGPQQIADLAAGTKTPAQINALPPIGNGDTDGDGDIDDSDLGTAFANYTGPVGSAGGKTFAQGDMDGDGDVDDSDLGTLFAAYTGPISEPEHMNVLFIIADDLTYTALGSYGNTHVKTPNLDALAARGMQFNAAFCQFPVCGQSRNSLLSGLYPPTINNSGSGTALDNILGTKATLPEHIKLSGITTRRVSKLYHMRVPGDITNGVAGPDHAPSWSATYNVQAPEWMSTGVPGHYTNENLSFTPTQHYNLGFGAAFYTVSTDTDGAEQADKKAADKAIEWIDELKDEPFFLAVGLVRPHVPLVAPSAYFDEIDPASLPLPQRPANDLADIPSKGIFWKENSRGPNTDQDRRSVLQAYYASVSFMDAQVGRILDELEAQGLDDNTIVVFTSDHGFHLGEHTQWQKLSLHQESAAVPLIISGPGIAQGNSPAIVELIDLYPTLCDLLEIPRPAHLQGVSLTPVFDDPQATVKDYAFSKTNDGELLRSTQWSYMRYSDGTEELYDMVQDPKQFTNLASDSAYVQTLQTLRAALDAKLVSMQP